MCLKFPQLISKIRKQKKFQSHFSDLREACIEYAIISLTSKQFVALLVALAVIFPNITSLQLTVSVAFILLMSSFILYETSSIIHDGQRNYIIATAMLSIYTFSLFISIYDLIILPYYPLPFLF